jgi:hypothetical protein
MVYKYVVIAKMKPILGFEPGAFSTVVRFIYQYAIDACGILRVNLIQYKIENWSLKTFHVEEVGEKNLKENVGNVSLALKCDISFKKKV